MKRHVEKGLPYAEKSPASTTTQEYIGRTQGGMQLPAATRRDSSFQAGRVWHFCSFDMTTSGSGHCATNGFLLTGRNLWTGTTWRSGRIVSKHFRLDAMPRAPFQDQDVIIRVLIW